MGSGMTMIPKLMCALTALTLCISAWALDMRAPNDNVVVYDGGSTQATPQFILLRGTPVELIVTTDKWSKIREAGGGMGWVERSQLIDRTQVIVTAANGEVRQAPDAASPLVFAAQKDVLLDIADKPVGGWVKVRHRDGQWTDDFRVVREELGMPPGRHD